jgi:hypothetical protein
MTGGARQVRLEKIGRKFRTQELMQDAMIGQMNVTSRQDEMDGMHIDAHAFGGLTAGSGFSDRRSV